MLRRLRRILATLALGLAALLVAFLVVIALQIRIDLEPFRKPFEAVASETVGRMVKLEGDFFLVPTWSLIVEANGLRIANPEGWGESEFARLELARFHFAVFPLLLRRLVVRELRAEGVAVFFERRADGAVNWTFPAGAAEDSAPTPEREAIPDTQPEPEAAGAGEPELPAESAGDVPPVWQRLMPRAVVIRKLALRDVQARIHDAVAGTTHLSALETIDGTVATDEPLQLQLAGAFRGHPFRASLETGDPDLLLAARGVWPLKFVLEIEDGTLTLNAQVDERSWDFGDAVRFFLETARSPFALLEGQRLAALKLDIEAERLDSLGGMFDVSLPPWGPLDLTGLFEFFGAGGISAEVVTRVGSSQLSGDLQLELRAEPPSFDLALEAPTIQLDDFRFEGWRAIETREAEPPEPDASEPPQAARALLSPEVMSSVDGRLKVDVAEVASGRDVLGKGRMSAQIEQGRFQLDALDVEIPGGSIETRASLTPGRGSVSASLGIEIERFDYGIFARRFVPETDMRGLFGMRVELESTAPSATRFVDHASGRFDVAVFPEQLEAGVVDLWAVNLAAAVLPATDSEAKSKINCLIALMTVRDGVMTTDTLLADTSRMTVHGEADFDLRKRWIELELAPAPKRPEFFSAATPIEVKGSFDEFDIDVDIDDLLGTVVRFLTSILHVPVRRLFHQEGPQDLETCMAALQRRESPSEP